MKAEMVQARTCVAEATKPLSAPITFEFQKMAEIHAKKLHGAILSPTISTGIKKSLTDSAPM